MNNKPETPQEQIRLLQEQVQDFERLNEVLEKVCSATQVEDTLKRIITESLHLCGADQASIVLIDAESDSEAMTLLREGQSNEKLDHFLNGLLSGWVTHYETALLTNDLVDTFGQKNVKAKYKGITSLLSVPLIQEGNIIGVINLLSENAAHLFGEREQQLMAILASQCALLIGHARLHDKLFAQNIRLRKEVQNRYERHGIIGHNTKMQEVFALLESVIPTDVRVLLEGETGTGKERIARAIHYSGPRQEAPFVAVDCGALPANLLESELFGYKKGAFTGASQDRTGLFEEADGGTLFLDEIANMPPEIQVKFLRAVQEGEIRPLGTSQVKNVDVRIIAAASNENLQQQVQTGKFRQDLYYRLNVVNIFLPPLRERDRDIAILADHFLKQMAAKYDKQIETIDSEAIAFLESYAWPGNIRELENAVERAVVLCKSNQLKRSDFAFLDSALSAQGSTTEFQPRPWEEAVHDLKRGYLSQVLAHAGGVKKQAAELLKIQPPYLSRLLKKLKLEE